MRTTLPTFIESDRTDVIAVRPRARRRELARGLATRALLLMLTITVSACGVTATTASVAAAQAASPPTTLAQTASTPVTGPLASLASVPIIVLPVQRLRTTVPGWREQVGAPQAYLSSVDDEIAFAVRERGVRAKWAFPSDLARAAKRNPTYAADPYGVAIDALAPVERDGAKIIGEPLASQLRALAALSDARYAVVPVELRLAPDSLGGRATLHVVVVDARQARLSWKGDVVGEPARAFSPAVAADLAGRVADLFTTR